RGFSGFAAFAKANGAWLERRGVHCGACAGPAGERRPESIRTGCRRRSAAFRGEGRAPPRRSRIRRERAKGFLPPSCKRNASPGAGGAAKPDAAGAFDSKAGAAPAQILINEKTNETAAMPTPLSNIGSGAEGPAAAADAREEAAKGAEGAKADYLLAIKANAGGIFGDIAVFFDMGAAIEIGAGRVEVLNKDIRSLRWVSKIGDLRLRK
ncbi:MAG: hypothetical protein LBU32_04380, partial [Clostridiales bacterium]|nr:hypothetical protein [Clostridiales bacterium]